MSRFQLALFTASGFCIGAGAAREGVDLWGLYALAAVVGLVAAAMWLPARREVPTEVYEIVDRVHRRRLVDALFASPADAHQEILRQGGSGIATVQIVEVRR